MNTHVAQQASQPALQAGLLRHTADWLLGLGLLSWLPLGVVFGCDLWFRSDFRFFPLLVIVPLGMAFWQGQRQPLTQPLRKTTALTLWLASGLSALCAPLLFSPWLAMLAMTLAWIGWQLERFGQTPWPRLLKWNLPLLLLLLLPLGERTDPLPNFASNVTYASSSLLDLLGIAHLPTEQTLELRSGRYDVAAACRGLGNPYLLFSLAVLLCMSTRCSLSIGFLTVCSSPLWSWGGSLLLVVSSVWLAEKQDIFIGTTQRLWIAQAIVLLGELLSLLFFKWGLQKLFAPFVAYSAAVGGAHKFFNRVVLWPLADPLRSRRSRSRSSNQASPPTAGDNQPWLVRKAVYALAAAACLYVIGGSITTYQLIREDNNWPRPTELLTHPSCLKTHEAQRLEQSILPDELFGMRLVKFEEFATPGSTTGALRTARWTYIADTQTVELQATAPYRGSVAIERQAVLDGNSIVDPPQTLELQLTQPVDADEGSQLAPAQVDSLGALPIQELTLRDSVVGLSYLAYSTWPIDGSQTELIPAGRQTGWYAWLATLAYQPTSASLSLWLEGETPQSDESKQKLQQMLGRATILVRQALEVN